MNPIEIFKSISGRDPAPQEEAEYLAGRAVAERYNENVRHLALLLSVLHSGTRSTAAFWRRDSSVEMPLSSTEVADAMFSTLAQTLIDNGVDRNELAAAQEMIFRVNEAQRHAG